jgi:hypothetical protein
MAWAPDYTTVERLRNYLNIDDGSDDTFLQVWITAVSRNVDSHCGRQFGKVDTADVRYFRPQWDRRARVWTMPIDDLYSSAGLLIRKDDASLVAADGYTLLPRNAAVLGRPYDRIKIESCTGELELESAFWGWSSVPPSIEAAMWLQAARLAARRDSPFGVAGSPSAGNEIRLLARLDPDFVVALKPFVRKWWAA